MTTNPQPALEAAARAYYDAENGPGSDDAWKAVWPLAQRSLWFARLKAALPAYEAARQKVPEGERQLLTKEAFESAKIAAWRRWRQCTDDIQMDRDAALDHALVAYEQALATPPPPEAAPQTGGLVEEARALSRWLLKEFAGHGVVTIGDMIAEIQRLEQSIATIRAETVAECKKIVTENQETFTNSDEGRERFLTPRRDGNIAGLAYADAISALTPGAKGGE
jgi:hypothetical protein